MLHMILYKIIEFKKNIVRAVFEKIAISKEILRIGQFRPKVCSTFSSQYLKFQIPLLYLHLTITEMRVIYKHTQTNH